MLLKDFNSTLLLSSQLIWKSYINKSFICSTGRYFSSDVHQDYISNKTSHSTKCVSKNPKLHVPNSFIHTSQSKKNSLNNANNGNRKVSIACASGFWGDSPSATSQILKHENLDFIIYDYLSEITMSLLTAAKARVPELGYAPDFVSHAIGPNLKQIQEKGIKIISNAGGINPEGCAEALRQVAKKTGVELKIGVVSGDSLMASKKEYIGKLDMHSKIQLPPTVHSMNAYVGSEPIVNCLDLGADVVITGRCADSSLALAPLVHSFDWKWNDFDLLASGSLAGHLIECGAQVTGGIFTDWEAVEDWDNIGFPVAEVTKDGKIKITKPSKTGGMISVGTVSEQLLYEIGDPRAYILPDVVCDFTKVQLHGVQDGVEVSGALGSPPTDSFKVCATYLDGYKATAVCCVGGEKSAMKGRKVAEALVKRCRKIFKALGLNDFTRVHIQALGNEDTYGPHAVGGTGPREAVLWLSVHHTDKKALNIFSMEIASAGTGMAPGLTSIVGGRPKAVPLLRLHSFLVRKEELELSFKVEDSKHSSTFTSDMYVKPETYDQPDQPTSNIPDNLKRGNKSYPLRVLAFARSGDKGDNCNIGVIARKASFLPYIQEALSKQSVATYFSHLFPEGIDPVSRVRRYEVEGIYALNFVLEGCLGGGGIASLRSDPQGKALGQMLLDFEIRNMPDLSTL